jgi:bifunctional DNA-binding transcriptional regulator/antitoxin component of YhaV-PrlF toxin-antitoxin module
VTQLQVSSQIRRVGNGLALIIPARDARRAGLAAGDPVDAILRSGVSDAFGLLSDLPPHEFERHREGLWRERL